MTSKKQATLVLGGTGKTGKLVAKQLEACGVPVRVGSRYGSPAFDWAEPSTWPAAVSGVEAVYLSFYPDLAAPGAAETVQSFTEVAGTHGVRRLVLLSGRKEEEAQRAERLVQASGLAWTVVRCAWFNQNFSDGHFLDPVRSGEVALPVGEVAEPFVDTRDIADVAVAALTDERHAGKLYELTGPRLLTFAQAVAEIASATARPLRFVQVSLADYVTALRSFALPSDVVDLVAYLFREVMDGRNASLADGVQQALGRAPLDFRDYAATTAATGIWNP